jgi:hypothetical protein
LGDFRGRSILVGLKKKKKKIPTYPGADPGGGAPKIGKNKKF